VDHQSVAAAIRTLGGEPGEWRAWRVAVAELTGGPLAARIAETPDSGDVFAGRWSHVAAK